jgi:hypothetical protein
MHPGFFRRDATDLMAVLEHGDIAFPEGNRPKLERVPVSIHVKFSIERAPLLRNGEDASVAEV